MPKTGRMVRKWWWLLIPGAFALFFLGVSAYVYFWPEATENQIRLVVTRALSDRFHTQVDLRSLKIKVYPILHVTGEGLVLRYHGRQDLPPLIQVEKFSFNAGITGLLHRVKHIPLVRVQHMVINIPPRQANTNQATSSANSNQQAAPDIIVDRVICDDTDLFVYPRNPEKPPLEWRIHDLLLTSAGINKQLAFTGNLTNAKPTGEIATHGQLAPGMPMIPVRLQCRASINLLMPTSVPCQALPGFCHPPENTTACFPISKYRAKLIPLTFRWTR